MFIKTQNLRESATVPVFQRLARRRRACTECRCRCTAVTAVCIVTCTAISICEKAGDELLQWRKFLVFDQRKFLDEEDVALEARIQVLLQLQLCELRKVRVVDVSINAKQAFEYCLGLIPEVGRESEPGELLDTKPSASAAIGASSIPDG